MRNDKGYLGSSFFNEKKLSRKFHYYFIIASFCCIIMIEVEVKREEQ